MLIQGKHICDDRGEYKRHQQAVLSETLVNGDNLHTLNLMCHCWLEPNS